MQLPSAGCFSHIECHTSVLASPLTADLEPPWTVFVHDCIARCSSFQERPTLPNISLLASTSCASLCFGGGNLGASKPTIFSHSRYTQGFPSWFLMPRFQSTILPIMHFQHTRLGQPIFQTILVMVRTLSRNKYPCHI